MSNLLIKNCDLLRFTNETPEILFNQDILIGANQIISIGDSLNPDLTSDIIRIDGKGMLAVPGMVNCHAHVPMVLFRGGAEDVTIEDWFNSYIFPMESNLTPEDVYWGALLGIAEMIEAGITNVADHYFFMDDVARAIEESGIRGNLAHAIFEHEGIDKLDETASFVNRWQGKANGRIRTWMGPHSPYLCGPEFLKQCVQLAEDLGAGIHIHVAETKIQVDQSIEKYGKTPVQLLADVGVFSVPTILAHCLFTDEVDLEIISENPVGIGQAPKTYMRLGKSPTSLKPYLDRGIPIGLASDGAASSSTMGLYEQMRLMALTQKVVQGDPCEMPIAEIIQIAYKGGAKVCQESDLGEIEPGKLADVVLLRQDRAAAIPRLNPLANLVYSLGSDDVDTVVCDGKIIYLHGEHQTLNLKEIRQEVESRLARLVQRVPGRKVAVYPT